MNIKKLYKLNKWNRRIRSWFMDACRFLEKHPFTTKHRYVLYGDTQYAGRIYLWLLSKHAWSLSIDIAQYPNGRYLYISLG